MADSGDGAVWKAHGQLTAKATNGGGEDSKGGQQRKQGLQQQLLVSLV